MPAGWGGKPSLLAAMMMSVLIVFMIVPEGFNYDRDVGTGMPTEGSPMSRLVWLTLLAFGAITVLRKWAQAKTLLRQVNPFYLALFALAVVSVLWSFDPGVTIRRCIRAATFLLDSLALALLGWRPTRFQDVVRPVLTVMLIGSIIFGLVSPKLAIEQGNQLELIGAWHGLAMQKNGLGSIGGIGLLLWWHAFLAKESKVWSAFLGCGVALACLVLSRSSTSLMATLFSCILMLMLLRSPPALRRYMPYLIAMFVGTILVYSLAVLNLVPGLGFVLKPITMLTGKDLTFSGRTAIWAIINEHIALSPILGTGYGAYWTGAVPTSPSYVTLQRLYFYPTEGHNGYLDVINDLGAVGVLCLLGYLLSYLRQGLTLFRGARTQGALFLSLLFLQLIANLSESRWFNVLSVEYVIMSFATVSMGRLLLQQKFAKRAALLQPTPARR